VFGLLKLQLALLPLLWSAFTEGDPLAGDPPADPPKDEPKFTQADVKRMIDTRLEEERQAAKRKADADKAKADEEKAKADGELQRAAELAQARADAAERERDEAQQRARDRIARAEVKATAVSLGFVNPDLAYRLIDTGALAFDDEGAVTNADTLLKDLATKEPYLLKPADSTNRGTPPATTPTRNANLSREELKNKYLEQAGVRR
jgi:hypothetical protein